MVDILHKVGIKSSPADVYTALTTVDGLAGWWTTNASGKGGAVDDVLQFGFAEMKILDVHQDKRVLWEVIGGPGEWVGTHIEFDLSQADDYTVVLFRHLDWREPVEMMHHCSTKWAIFLMSLKSLVETGKGAPGPDNDVKIDNWN
jgi:uncharacterized protein YndB with AHSA1/START domain